MLGGLGLELERGEGGWKGRERGVRMHSQRCRRQCLCSHSFVPIQALVLVWGQE